MTYVQATAVQIKEAYDTVWRHRLLVILAFAVLMALSVAFIATTPRSYRVSSNVLVVNGNRRNDPTLSSPDLPSLATSTEVLSQVRKNLSLDVPLLALKRGVNAKPPAYMSGIMRIEYSDPSPDRAAQIANGIADELATYYNQLSTARYDDDLRTLDGELAKQRVRISKIDADLRSRNAVQALALDDKGRDALVDELNALETQRALANAELEGDAAAATAASDDVHTRSEAARRDILQADPTYVSLQTQSAVASSELAAARAQYTSRYPGLPQLQEKADRLKTAVAAEAAGALSAPHAFSPTAAASVLAQNKADAVVAADRAKVAALEGEIARQRSQVDGMAPLELLGLEREAAMNEYRSIAAHRSSTLLDRADALSLGSVVVVDRALGSQAVASISPLRLSATFGLFCLLIAIAFAFLAEQLNPRLRRVSQIESLYGKPVVATLGRSR